MTRFGLPLLALVPGLLPGAAAAAANAPVSAARYVDAQGVEVIHNRNAELPSGAAAAASAPAQGKIGSVRAQPASNAPPDPRLQISADEQQRRDRDRVAILQAELDVESRRYEAAWQRLQGGDNKNGAAAVQRMNEELHDHQKNIEALHAELRRARVAR